MRGRMTGRRGTSQFMPVGLPMTGKAKVEMRINECGELMELESSDLVPTDSWSTSPYPPAQTRTGAKRAARGRGTRVMRSLAADICEIWKGMILVRGGWDAKPDWRSLLHLAPSNASMALANC